MRRLTRDVRFWVSGSIVLCIFMIAIFGPALAPHPPNAMKTALRLTGPGPEYLLGGDEFGRDILSRLLAGARLSLTISLSAVAIAAVAGTIIGLVSGYFEGAAETILMRIVDVILAFPTILLALFVVVFIGPDLHNLIMTIGILYIPRFARVIYAATLSAKAYDYIEAARAIGASTGAILVRGIFPSVVPPLIVQMSLSVGDAILLASSLGFLGLGPPPPSVDWGRMVAEVRPFIHLSPYVLLWTSLAISITVLAFNVLGDCVRDALDPRLRS